VKPRGDIVSPVRHLPCAAAALVLLTASASFANGRYPSSNQIAFSPTSGNLVVLRATYGILLSHDDGGSWTWLCEDALGISASAAEDPSLGLTATDALIAGLYRGLEVSRDTGCDWSFVPAYVNQHAIDIAVRSPSPHSAVVLLSTFSSTAVPDSSVGYVTQLIETADDGATWTALGGPFDPTVAVTTLDVAASDPNRLYVTGFRASALFTPVLFVSLDHGASWSEHAMPPLSHDLGVYIAAVDPGNADLVYLRTAGSPNALGRSRLFVTHDQGQSFQTVLSLPGSMLGFALSPDGSKVYAGIEKGGLFAASRDALLAAADAGGGLVPVTVGDAGGSASGAFRQTSSIHVQCLATRGTELWACSDEASGFVAGVSLDDGVAFTPKLHLNGIAGPIACGADATAAQCSGAAFQQLCQVLKGCGDGGSVEAGAADAGAPDAGAVDASIGSTTPDGSAPDAGSAPVGEYGAHGSSCGCSAVGGGHAVGLVAAIGAAIAVWRRRRTGATRATGPEG
jgi:MYXO-CTERM domain-containing protein